MFSDLEKFAPDFSDEVMYIAARSAFKLGHPDDSHRKAILRIHLDYDGSQPTLRRRFKLKETEVWSFEQELARFEDPAKREAFKGRLPTEDSSRATEWEQLNNGAVVAIKFFAFEAKSRMPAAYTMFENTIPYSSFWLPPSQLTINAKWSETLRKSLARAEQPIVHILPVDDLFASETPARAKEIYVEGQPPDQRQLTLMAMNMKPPYKPSKLM